MDCGVYSEVGFENIDFPQVVQTFWASQGRILIGFLKVFGPSKAGF